MEHNLCSGCVRPDPKENRMRTQFAKCMCLVWGGFSTKPYYCQEVWVRRNKFIMDRVYTKSLNLIPTRRAGSLLILFINVTKCLEWYLAHSRRWINTCWINESNESQWWGWTGVFCAQGLLIKMERMMSPLYQLPFQVWGLAVLLDFIKDISYFSKNIFIFKNKNQTSFTESNSPETNQSLDFGFEWKVSISNLMQKYFSLQEVNILLDHKLKYLDLVCTSAIILHHSRALASKIIQL